MCGYPVVRVSPGDARMLAQVDALLQREGLMREAHLDCICAALDEEGQAVATGSCFGQSLRCFAVDPAHRGSGVLNTLVSWLTEFQAEQGNTHLFVCTKAGSAVFFRDLGFYEIARAEEAGVSLLENRRSGFSDYLRSLRPQDGPGPCGAVVMNAAPFTLGHRHLAKTAAAACGTLHLFILSEDVSPVPFAVRLRLAEQGVKDLPNVAVHPTGPYLISSATFPSYFLKDAQAVIRAHAQLDAAVFVRAAKALGIDRRFAGEEPLSTVTAQYNACMARVLPRQGIACEIIPRKTAGGRIISASTVRTALRAGDWKTLETMLPETTLSYFRSPQAADVMEAIRRAEDLVHY